MLTVSPCNGVKNVRFLRGVRVNVLDCDIIVSEFELQSHYEVYFGTNALLFFKLWFK